jgi:hypothetical protein
MSDKAGRQSPSPSRAPEQVSHKDDGKVNAAPSDTHSKDSSEESKHTGALESNPKGPLEDEAAKKTMKGGVRSCLKHVTRREDGDRMRVER